MKKLKFFTRLFAVVATFYAVTLNAQVTTVMKAKVNVITGTQITTIDNLNLDLTNVDTPNLNINHIEIFKLKAENIADINLKIDEDIELTNQFGEVIKIKNNTKYHTNNDGTHTLKLIDFDHYNINEMEYQGNYNGDMIAVIDYL